MKERTKGSEDVSTTDTTRTAIGPIEGGALLGDLERNIFWDVNLYSPWDPNRSAGFARTIGPTELVQDPYGQYYLKDHWLELKPVGPNTFVEVHQTTTFQVASR